ncbi:MAG: GNAT family N-acetyltransferase [Bacteroidetes bacterium]|nr:GNAT family N-acetyltransferase [Bacteroidota bacterium]
MKIELKQIESGDNVEAASLIRGVFHEFSAPQIGTAYSDPTTDHLYEKFRTAGSALWLALVDGELAGCCGIYPTEGLPPGCAELVRFFVKKEFRNQGIGRLLMQQCTDNARQSGYIQLYLESIPEFDRAIGIYETMGYRHLTAPLCDTGHNTCSVWMLKTL